MNERLRRILRISLRLGNNTIPTEEDELYAIMRMGGFQSDFINNFRLDFTQINDLTNYMKAEKRVLDENIQEHYAVLSSGEMARMLLFKKEQTLYYHIKVDDAQLFSFVYLNDEGEWAIRNYVAEEHTTLFEEILPYLWKVGAQ